MRNLVISFLFAFFALAGGALVAEGASPSAADTARFLEQATWGPDPALIARVRAVGFSAFLHEQLHAPVSLYPSLSAYPAKPSDGCPSGSAPNCVRDNYTMSPLQRQFFLNALGGPDQLRQRVAFALHEILVVSGVQIRQPSSMAPYLNLLARDALGNYRQLLEDITLNPAMGDYLDMANNDKASADGSLQPNENYGREILQLFSTGVNMLHSDGTTELDSEGNPIPAYTQDTIEGFSQVFTGWTYAPLPGTAPRRHNPRNYLAPMQLFRDGRGVDADHDKGAKQLLAYPQAAMPVLPPNQDGAVDLSEALDNIFHHPNVGPFLGRQLIQHLVTSNPSPGYVARVAAVFDDNGAGVRGDLGAVVSAILLDPEARGDSKDSADYGRLREPVQLVLNVLRAFDASSDGNLAFASKSMGQDLFYAASVFSYYPHAFQVPGTQVQGPEFGIESTATAISRANFVTGVAFSAGGGRGTTIDLSGLAALANDSSALVERLDQILMHGSMSGPMRQAIIGAVEAVDASDAWKRAQTALDLVATSSQYQVER